MLTIIGDKRPWACRSHCAAVAAAPNAVHNATSPATKATVLPASPRLLFRLPKTDTMGIAVGSIIAAIMTAHMMKTASQFAPDQSDMGIVSWAAGLPMLVAPQQSRSQPARAGSQTTDPIDACARIASLKLFGKLGVKLDRRMEQKSHCVRRCHTQSRSLRF